MSAKILYSRMSPLSSSLNMLVKGILRMLSSSRVQVTWPRHIITLVWVQVSAISFFSEVNKEKKEFTPSLIASFPVTGSELPNQNCPSLLI